MRYNEVIQLISVSYEVDDLGNRIPISNKREVFCNKLALGINEFSSAGQLGYKPDKAFKFYSFEYKNEQEAIFKRKRYQIYRIAENGEFTTIYCQEVIADGGRFD
ncbi:phage head closure protein [Companilactobacillus metriopterae]|uniref:phage head closure protein n=1 Tax=Companilactobacillus metriopterae TaxID=1909267 RepID=UPI0013E93C48|nr:phage head closure protein [Companilactobacillus metriopterae]